MSDLISPMQVAIICHQANKNYCEQIGDDSQLDWDKAPEWQRDSAYDGVVFCINNPDAGPDANHKSWYEHKLKDGWKYGPVKNANLKEHPCMVDFDSLPETQKAKDRLFKAIVDSLSSVIGVVKSEV